jgi:hypothetical protein
LNIILVTGASARARTITLEARHWAAGGVALLVLFVIFTLAFNFVTLKWAAAVQHPWLQAIVLADQREQADTSMQWRCAWASCKRGCCCWTAWVSASPRSRG